MLTYRTGEWRASAPVRGTARSCRSRAGRAEGRCWCVDRVSEDVRTRESEEGSTAPIPRDDVKVDLAVPKQLRRCNVVEQSDFDIVLVYEVVPYPLERDRRELPDRRGHDVLVLSLVFITVLCLRIVSVGVAERVGGLRARLGACGERVDDEGGRGAVDVDCQRNIIQQDLLAVEDCGGERRKESGSAHCV